jgi:hypothetical protein
MALARKGKSKSPFTTQVSVSTRNILNPCSRMFYSVNMTCHVPNVIAAPGSASTMGIIQLTDGQYNLIKEIHDMYTLVLASRKYDKIPTNYDHYLSLLNNLSTINVTNTTLHLLIDIVAKTLTGCMNVINIYENSMYNELQILLLNNKIDDILSNKNNKNVIADEANFSGNFSVNKTFKLSKFYSYYIYLYGLPEYGVGFDPAKLQFLKKSLELFNQLNIDTPDTFFVPPPGSTPITTPPPPVPVAVPPPRTIFEIGYALDIFKHLENYLQTYPYGYYIVSVFELPPLNQFPSPYTSPEIECSDSGMAMDASGMAVDAMDASYNSEHALTEYMLELIAEESVAEGLGLGSGKPVQHIQPLDGSMSWYDGSFNTVAHDESGNVVKELSRGWTDASLVWHPYPIYLPGDRFYYSWNDISAGWLDASNGIWWEDVSNGWLDGSGVWHDPQIGNMYPISTLGGWLDANGSWWMDVSGGWLDVSGQWNDATLATDVVWVDTSGSWQDSSGMVWLDVSGQWTSIPIASFQIFPRGYSLIDLTVYPYLTYKIRKVRDVSGSTMDNVKQPFLYWPFNQLDTSANEIHAEDVAAAGTTVEDTINALQLVKTFILENLKHSRPIVNPTLLPNLKDERITTKDAEYEWWYSTETDIHNAFTLAHDKFSGKVSNFSFQSYNFETQQFTTIDKQGQTYISNSYNGLI